jgi:two-component system LytT family sensor kinase
MKKFISKKLKMLLLHFIFWFVVWFFFSSFFSVGSKNENFIFWFSSILSTISVAASYVFIYYLIPVYLIPKKHKLFVLYLFYAIVFITCAVLMTVVFGFVFFYNLEFQSMPNLTKSPGVILVCVLLIVALTSSFKILKYNFKYLEEKNSFENKFLQTQLQLKEQELKFLKMQIHPHFLFNALNTIYGFSLLKAEEAPEMILKLSNLLDYILYQIEKPSVLLEEEVNHLEDYISLEKMRFHDSLQVNFKKEIGRQNVQISPMLLIPFVENSFKHGAVINGLLQIDIHLKVDQKNLFFMVKNAFKNKEYLRTGIGIENIRKRLEMTYFKKYQLEIIEENNIFNVLLNINLERSKTNQNE